MNASKPAYGRARASIAAADGKPSSKSSQCTTTSRPESQVHDVHSGDPKPSITGMVTSSGGA
jgi:hypothetical protein